MKSPIRTRVSLTLAVSAVVALGLVAAPVPASAATSPLIQSESISHITETDATLEAQINPGGLETTYKFRLAYGCGIDPEHEACPMYCVPEEPCPTARPKEIPLPADKLPASSEIETASLNLNDAGVTLQPGTKYRYSVEATNVEGSEEGSPQFFTTPSTSAPSIESESASDITETDATLEAQINPQSPERGVHYQFQVVKDASEYLPEFACPTEGFPAGTSLCLGLPSQAGALPISGTAAGMQDQSVSLDLGSAGLTLQPGTTYHYRVIAARIVQTEDTIAWEPPIVYGSDRTFTTPSASMPSIASESISRLTQTDATLEAQINSEGLEASYQFRLESGCLPPLACLAIVTYPLPSGTLLGSFVDQSVSLDLNSASVTLHPDTKYRYSVDASNSAGTTEGSGQIFTTPPETGVEPLTEPSAAVDPQSSTTTQPSPSTSLPHQRRHHRRHKRGRGLRSLGRASAAG